MDSSKPNDVLQKLADAIWQQSITNRECCDLNAICEYHDGFLDGLNSMVYAIENELSKVGFTG